MSMNRKRGMILYNVLNQEVVFEEYFCNLLQFSEFKNLFLDFVNIENKNIEYENFNTEVVLSNEYGRADLFLKVEKNIFIFEIKNKCYTALTKNQPNGYLKYLEYKNKQLYFLVPRQYEHIDKINKRWEDHKNYNDSSIQILFWEDFINMLEKSNIFNNKIEIKYFYDFCLYWFNMEVIKFTNEEKRILNNKDSKMENLIDISIPRFIEKLEHIITNIGDNSSMKKDSNAISINYSKTIGNYIIYFGIDYDMWEKENQPLTLTIQNNANNFKEFDLKIDNENLIPITYEETNISESQFAYLIKLKTNLGNDDFQEIVEEHIKNITKSLNKRT